MKTSILFLPCRQALLTAALISANSNGVNNGTLSQDIMVQILHQKVFQLHLLQAWTWVPVHCTMMRLQEKKRICLAAFHFFISTDQVIQSFRARALNSI